MKITCPKCGICSEIKISKMPQEGREFSCPKCGGYYFAKPSGDNINTTMVAKPSLPAKHARGKVVSIAVLVSILGVLIVWSCSQSGEQKPNNSSPETTLQQLAEKQEEMDSLDARTFAKIYVKRSVKAPSTAEFQNVLDFGVAPKKDKKGKKIKDVWEVSGYVDAQNSYGAMLRQQWYIILQKKDGNWLPLYIKVGN